MKRRIFAVIAAVIIFTLGFSSCTSTEIRFLSLMDEMQSLQKFNVTGELSYKINDYYSFENDETKKIEVAATFNAMVDMEDKLYMNAPIKITYNGKSAAFEIIYNIDKDNFAISISKDGYLDVMTLFNDNAYSPEIVKYLKEQLSGVEYIELLNSDDMDTAEMYKLTKSNDRINKLFMDYIKEAFPKFETKLIGETSDGFILSVDPESAFEVFVRLIENISDNRELVWEKTNKLIIDYSRMMPQISEVMGDESEIGLNKEEFYSGLDEFIEDMETYKDETNSQVNALYGSSANLIVHKTGSTYSQNFDIKGVYEGETLFTFKSSSKITPVSKVTPKIVNKEKTMSVYDVDDKADDARKAIVPVNAISVSWYPGETEGYASADVIYQDGYKDYEMFQFYLIDGSTYLPLRQVAELFGEKVGWDAEKKMAYVMRGDEKIDMTGKIIEGTTFVKIRDFEKLGYKVGYEKVKLYVYVTVEKAVEKQ